MKYRKKYKCMEGNMKKSLLIISMALTATVLVSCSEQYRTTENQTPRPIIQQESPSPTPIASPSPAPSAPEELSPISVTGGSRFLTGDDAKEIVVAWLDRHTELPPDSLSVCCCGIYPSHIIFGDPYYSFFVDGMPVSLFSILVHIETGELLFKAKIEDGFIITVIGLLDDWYSWEYIEHTPEISVDQARGIYFSLVDDAWLSDYSNILNSQSFWENEEEYEIFGQRYYLFYERIFYWYSVIAHMDTGELFLQIADDGMYSEIIIKEFTVIDLESDWWEWDGRQDWWDWAADNG